MALTLALALGLYGPIAFVPPSSVMHSTFLISSMQTVGDDSLVNGVALATFVGICAVQTLSLAYLAFTEPAKKAKKTKKN